MNKIILLVLTTNDHLQTFANFLKFFHVLLEKSIKISVSSVVSSINKISSDISASSVSYKANFELPQFEEWKIFCAVLIKTQQNPYENVTFS